MSKWHMQLTTCFTGICQLIRWCKLQCRNVVHSLYILGLSSVYQCTGGVLVEYRFLCRIICNWLLQYWPRPFWLYQQYTIVYLCTSDILVYLQYTLYLCTGMCTATLSEYWLWYYFIPGIIMFISCYLYLQVCNHNFFVLYFVQYNFILLGGIVIFKPHLFLENSFLFNHIHTKISVILYTQWISLCFV